MDFGASVILANDWHAGLQSLDVAHNLFRAFLGKEMPTRTLRRRPSHDLEDNLSAIVSAGRTLVRFMRIRQVVLAVDPDT
jgi:hypothetical protein